MLSRLPWTPQPSKKKRDREEAKRRATLVAAAVIVMGRARRSKFEFEGPCRHALRTRFCLEGEIWERADTIAASIVAEALRRIGAWRPTWFMGQPDYVDGNVETGRPVLRGEGPTRAEYLSIRTQAARDRALERRTKCEHCGKLYTPRPCEVIARKYCSHQCYGAAKPLARYEARACAACGLTFSPANPVARFCSNVCRQRGHRARQSFHCEAAE